MNFMYVTQLKEYNTSSLNQIVVNKAIECISKALLHIVSNIKVKDIDKIAY